MKAAILGGTGVYSLDGIQTIEQTVETEFGSVTLKAGTGQWEDLYFISRHGTDHSIPPHMVNYRANIQALKELGIDR
ncbi:MAG: S-methyl-5'-thioadenosine phosphorylase, partial [Spirochaetaceae bacterium]|nr:S-methyl-5'-thioadenosine phosphorylase [Spirochaetaceae bacterium]